MKYIALICARGGSKGLPGKNIKLLNGIPLIAWSIKTAKKVNRISRIIVSTDSKEIAKVALEYGAEVPFMRPAELAQDKTPEWLVWQHALDYLEKHEPQPLAGLVNLPTTAPLRSHIDVEKCLDEYEAGGVDVVITVTESHRSPYFNMVTSDNNGYSSLVISGKRVHRRQDTPVVYDMTTVAYVAKPKFVQKGSGIFDGRVRSVKIPVERAIDIDTELDFRIAEWTLKEVMNEIKHENS
jgi:N-acylneuraminate cytidylyltransferase